MNIYPLPSLELLHSVTRDLAERLKELHDLQRQVLEAEMRLLQEAAPSLELAYAA